MSSKAGPIAPAPKTRPQGKRPWWQIAGAIFGTLFVACLGVLFLAMAILYAHPEGDRDRCSNNLQNIGLALSQYAAVYREFPPTYTVDENGKPLHSWRTLILPYLDQQALYDTIDLAQPWDAPANACNTQLPIYQCPSANLPANHTTYLALVGPGSALEGGRPRPLSEITDGASNTALIIEVPADLTVPWMAPEDADEALFLALGSNPNLSHPSGFNVLMADGSVRFLKADTPADVRKALFTCAGGEPLPAGF